jgi:hypothetical protein
MQAQCSYKYFSSMYLKCEVEEYLVLKTKVTPSSKASVNTVHTTLWNIQNNMNLHVGCVFVTNICQQSQSYPCYRLSRPIILWDVGGPLFSRHSVQRWWWGCQPYAPAALYPPEGFLVLIFDKGSFDPRTIVGLERLGQLKNPMAHRESNPRLQACTKVFVFDHIKVVQVQVVVCPAIGPRPLSN